MIRRLPILLACAAVVAAACPSSASAGTYVVSACSSSHGINNSWQPFRSNTFANAYSACPAGVFVNGRANEGMVARNTSGSGVAPGFSSAQMSFNAPEGARITQVSGHIVQTSTGGWQSGIRDVGANRWVWCGAGCTSTFGTWVPFNVLVSSNRVAALTICGSGSGCARDGLHGYVALRDVNVVIAEDSAPSVAITGGALVAPGWRRGIQDVLVEGRDAVGVRHTRALIDGTQQQQFEPGCDYTRTVPCPNGTNALTIDTRALADGSHKLRAQVVDTAGNSRSVDRLIAVDNHAPAAPLGLSVDGGAGWRSSDTFSLRWRFPAQPAAPVARAFIDLCPLGTTGGATCVNPRSVGRVTSTAVRVPGAGEWRVRVWLQDAAGNATITNAAGAVLRFDDAPPALAFERPSAHRPAVVRVAASDERSGLGTREILIRRRGTAAWLSLPVTLQPSGFSAFIDDESLPDGVYELRARAIDLAGNERSTERTADGKLAEVELPLRVRTTLRVGRPTRVRARGANGRRRYRIKLVDAPRAGYGRTIPLRGRLTSPGGNPLGGREVRVLEQTKLPASPWRLIATVRTTPTGHFTFRALRGPSRTLRVRFHGTDTIRGRTADVRLGVRAATSISVSRHRVVNGEDVNFRGRLRGRPLPKPGKLIELQAYARGQWRTFGTARANSRTGRWSYPYRFSATRGNVRYRFRARIPKDASYPYETGASRRVNVSVDGL